ncbi:MAG TPA: sn-glycerol-1-phosphate dehydrogenase [Micropruina sp.]|nr:sn-glycerol-1-phosphate dehydrogenase [Propionibacterium sp.]HMQ36833.1 sn-glycerol-1-phosphate dehydrogenase [Micropruina sp.]HMR21234.1 sn-glycerol-1-phosphate dehydrogenase [Micropruina sp.]
MSDLIERALLTATDTRTVIAGPDAIAAVAESFRATFGDRPALVVGDERTMSVAGDAVMEALASGGVRVVDPYVFPGEPELYAKYENCELLRDALRDVDAVPVAVGAGTLNDVVKRAAGELERPYLVVATAASMDGYTAFGSSIAVGGYKQTLDCPAPAGCVADWTVLAAAPAVMTASGYGDLLGKVPAGADWMIADAVGVEPLDDNVWQLVQGPLRASLSRPEAVAAGELAAIGELAEGLVMSGLAMQAHASSRPASGAEHQFAHLWEMEGHGTDVTPRRLSHGFKVAVGSVAMAALYERLLLRDLARLDVDAAVAAYPDAAALEARVRAVHQPHLVDEIVAQSLAKHLTPEQLRQRLELVAALWGELRPRLQAQLIPAADLQRMLRAAGTPAHPYDIGLGWQQFRDTYRRAQMIRKRYTALDLLLEADLLDELVDELFAPGGFWAAQRG